MGKRKRQMGSLIFAILFGIFVVLSFPDTATADVITKINTDFYSRQGDDYLRPDTNYNTDYGNIYKISGTYGNIKKTIIGSLKYYKNNHFVLSGRSFTLKTNGNKTDYIGIRLSTKAKFYGKFIGYVKDDALIGDMRYDNPWIKIYSWQHKYSWTKLPPDPIDPVKEVTKKFTKAPKTIKGWWYSKGKIKYHITAHSYHIYGYKDRIMNGRMIHPGRVSHSRVISYYKHPSWKGVAYEDHILGTISGSYYIPFKVKDTHGRIHHALMIGLGTKQYIFYRTHFKGAKYQRKVVKRMQSTIYGEDYTTATERTQKLIDKNKTVNISELK